MASSRSVTNVYINNTVGSVASQEDVIKGMQTVRRQIHSDAQRKQTYGGYGVA
jgi:hypothetical protein